MRPVLILLSPPDSPPGEIPHATGQKKGPPSCDGLRAPSALRSAALASQVGDEQPGNVLRERAEPAGLRVFHCRLVQLLVYDYVRPLRVGVDYHSWHAHTQSTRFTHASIIFECAFQIRF